MTEQRTEVPAAEDRERKVFVGRLYTTMSPTWHEWVEKSFEDVCEAISKKREDAKPNQSPDEIIEVLVLRRARIKTTVEIEVDADG